MVSVIGLINTSRHAFSSMVGDDMNYFSHFSSCGWFKRSEASEDQSNQQ